MTARGMTSTRSTGQPYEPDVVNEGDFVRVMVEFWADGPKSETPPGPLERPGEQGRRRAGHEPADRRQRPAGRPTRVGCQDVPRAQRRGPRRGDRGLGPEGALRLRPADLDDPLHGQPRASHRIRPGRRSTRTACRSCPDLIEVITDETTAPGDATRPLAGHEGEIAIRAWAGVPADPKTQASGVTWILAVQWVPYQLPTFVTPAFQGYVSGHSTFSRAGAEVMTAMTGSAFFPGGVSGYTIPVGSLKNEIGPTSDDQARVGDLLRRRRPGRSVADLGGIHIAADDFNGRRIGSECGLAAWARAQLYYAGTRRIVRRAG